MGNLVKTVNSVESKIVKLLEAHNLSKEKIVGLKEQLQKKDSEILSLQKQIESLTQENQNLKTTNALLGSSEHRKETKLKINSLIKEINHCITQLSE